MNRDNDDEYLEKRRIRNEKRNKNEKLQPIWNK